MSYLEANQGLSYRLMVLFSVRAPALILHKKILEWVGLNSSTYSGAQNYALENMESLITYQVLWLIELSNLQKNNHIFDL